jgi:hypothetical protein
MITKTGVWVEDFAAADANKIKYTDNNGDLHTPPASVAVSVVSTGGAGMENGRVVVYALSAPYNAATYTPADIDDSTFTNGEILAAALSATGAASTSITYTADIDVLVRTRKAGYKPFEVGTTLTSSGLSVTALNEIDTVYTA